MPTPPGYYPAQGDPPGTVRYWDGDNWITEPLPPPPGFNLAGIGSNDRYVNVWVRIGASLIDGLVTLIVLIPFMIGYFRDLFDDIDAGGDGSTVEVSSGLIFIGLGVTVIFFLMDAYLGGSPGKLALGLRITRSDGVTTPPGPGPAALRALPNVATAIPVIGALISIGMTIGSIIAVATDPERRSLYDRIANTRVVHKNRL